MIINGAYGPYIKGPGRFNNGKIPKDVDPKSITLEAAQKMLDEKTPARGRFAKKASTKSTKTKSSATSKTKAKTAKTTKTSSSKRSKSTTKTAKKSKTAASKSKSAQTSTK